MRERERERERVSERERERERERSLFTDQNHIGNIVTCTCGADLLWEFLFMNTCKFMFKSSIFGIYCSLEKLCD